MPQSDGFFTLARTEHGVSCLFCPGFLPDGSRNRLNIQRLKDKAGNRSNASDATEMAAAIVPEGHAFNDLLPVIASEVASAIDGLLGDLDRRIDALRAGQAAPELAQVPDRSPELQQNSDGVVRLPEWLPRGQSGKKESVEARCSIAAA